MLAVFIKVTGAPTHLPFLLAPLHTVPPALTTHILASTSAHWFAHTHMHLPTSLDLCPQSTPSRGFPWPRGLSHPAPLPHACSPLYALLTSPTFIPAQTSPHLLTLACLPVLHTGSLVCFCSHLPMHSNTLAFQCPHNSLARAPTVAGFTHSTRIWITKLIPGHPSNPSACLATPVVLSPPRDQCTLHSSPCHECRHGPWRTPPRRALGTLPSPSQDCPLLGSPLLPCQLPSPAQLSE